jgi:hypothetical protein
VTFDEWWNGEAGPKGRWVGDYETDAEANARIGWEAALSHKCQRCDYPNCFCKVAQTTNVAPIYPPQGVPVLSGSA